MYLQCRGGKRPPVSLHEGGIHHHHRRLAVRYLSLLLSVLLLPLPLGAQDYNVPFRPRAAGGGEYCDTGTPATSDVCWDFEDGDADCSTSAGGTTASSDTTNFKCNATGLSSSDYAMEIAAAATNSIDCSGACWPVTTANDGTYCLRMLVSITDTDTLGGAGDLVRIGGNGQYEFGYNDLQSPGNNFNTFIEDFGGAGDADKWVGSTETWVCAEVVKATSPGTDSITITTGSTCDTATGATTTRDDFGTEDALGFGSDNPTNIKIDNLTFDDEDCQTRW
jgi:hypothetical protein